MENKDKEEEPLHAARKQYHHEEVHINGEEDDNDDDQPCLSSHALAALQEFLLQNQPQIDDDNNASESLKVELLTEDWRLSQFWYDSSTAQIVADELNHLSGISGSPVACIACPTLYVHLKVTNPEVEAHIFEFDRRFEKYGTDFIFYDYNQPEDFPYIFHHKFQVVVADPPYLSEECLSKVCKTMALLANQKNAYLLLLTGKVQEQLAAKLLNLRPCKFRPTHHNKLGNEFMLFTNYDPEDRLGGWENSG